MIYIKRDKSLIPDHILKVAERAQTKLETLPKGQRKDFIKKKSHIWRSFAKYLSKMSHGKCWYSETKDPGANFDVDHFRPKAEAKRSEDEIDEDGYPWLAFNWENFRLAAQNSNRLNTHDVTEEVNGKGSWFPLLTGSPKADWNNRAIGNERPELIDPVNKNDLKYVDFDATGKVIPSSYCVGMEANRVTRSAILYGLNLPKIKDAREEVMREVIEIHEIIQGMAVDLKPLGDDAPMGTVEKQINFLKQKTKADAAFSMAARAQLQKLGYPDLFIDRTLDAI